MLVFHTLHDTSYTLYVFYCILNPMKQTKGKINWLDFNNPSELEIRKLQKDYKLHDVIAKELNEPSARARVEILDGYLYLIYYFPSYNIKEQTSKRSEIDFIITKNTVITVHYDKIEPLTDLKNNENLNANNSFELAYKIISELLVFQDRQLRHIREKVEEIGSILFKNKERKALEEISRIKRDISEYRIIARHQNHLLTSFTHQSKRFFGQIDEAYAEDLIGDQLKIVNQLEDYRLAIADFEDTNNQLMNIKINESMKTFTILSFLTFPFVLFVAIVDLGFKSNPFHSIPGMFWVVVSLVLIGMYVLYQYFKNKRWL